MGTRHLGLGFGRDRANHVQSQQLGPLRNNQAHSTGRSVQQDGFTALKRIDLAAQIRRRQTTHGHRRSLLATDRFRQRDQRSRIDQTLGAVRPQGVGEARVGHAITGLDVLHTSAYRLHDARGFVAQSAWQRYRIDAATEVGVCKVQTHSDVAQAHLARSWITDLGRFKAHDFGRTGFVKFDNCVHGYVSVEAFVRVRARQEGCVARRCAVLRSACRL